MAVVRMKTAEGAPTTFPVLINGTLNRLPAIHASGTLEWDVNGPLTNVEFDFLDDVRIDGAADHPRMPPAKHPDDSQVQQWDRRCGEKRDQVDVRAHAERSGTGAHQGGRWSVLQRHLRLIQAGAANPR